MHTTIEQQKFSETSFNKKT